MFILPITLLLLASALYCFFQPRPGKLPPLYPFDHVPILGHMTRIPFVIPYETLKKGNQLLGEIFTIQQGPRRLIVLSSHTAVHHFFMKHRQHLKNTEHSNASYHTISKSRGEYWHFARKLLLRKFMFLLKKKEHFLQEEIDRFLVEIRTRSHTFIPFRRAMRLSVVRMIMHMTGAAEYANKGDDEAIISLLEENLPIFDTIFLTDFLPFSHLYGGNPDKKTKFTKNLKETLALMETFVSSHEKHLDVTQPKDFIDELLLTRQKNSKLSIDCMLFDIFAGGTLGVSTLCEWAIGALCAHPRYQELIFTEITSVLGTRRPTIEDLPKLPMLCAVAKETLRWRHVGALPFIRQVSEDISYGEYVVPKGSSIGMFNYGVLHDPEVWERPDDFWPERWFKEENHIPFQGGITGRKTECMKFVPFSVSDRSCPGYLLASYDMHLYISALVFNFKFKADSLDLSVGTGMLIAPKPFSVIFEKRELLE